MLLPDDLCMILWSSELKNKCDFGLFQLCRKGQCCINMSHMPVWAVRALRLPSRRLWRCLAVLGGQGFHSIQHYFEMWHLYFHSFLSVLFFPHSFTLHCSLSDTGCSSPKIPSQQFHLALTWFWSSGSYLPLKWALVWKIWKIPHLEAQLHSQIHLNLLIHQRWKK